ncbi:conserved hypothetical protein [Buchnera aphidicola str. Bp (Baizongia pistaciae)]|uniref:tRNA uridine(34) hydroxylase n=1 Tax=Buchnera aphidicola subsp. Baizongia pistaciae (strain Bp) TaxID=224915 RepID=TRHO_BUCBP|nr:rhodanese-related sulfurtransferase [Buchnera aphidicola]Q89AG4.1 RecName: Full=tRNA uridine(34) hydroxylase; AltName: Full=tRNA hydroxylation protein O [Buchnera aphidicola str. Bp (Baizongia pistaciae)]AAO27051.1 conserved hypothetical protein [Buchnera aphidicola str. Bp (Baizongia pistaciae)]
MLYLYNKHPRIKLRNAAIFDNINRVTVSFYKYIFIHEPIKFRNSLYRMFFKFNIFGRVYIANEGINAQISIPKKIYHKAINIITTSFAVLKDINVNLALDNRESFWVLRMKVRKKILFDNLPIDFFDPNNVGTYLSAKDVNNMLENKNSVLVDMRNHYEYKIGHFDSAINVPVNTFREQLFHIVDFLKHYKNRDIIMYCTGGIRCEKATAWIKYNGFKNVYQIKGGIIKYVRDARIENLLVKFRGKNFVFDERMSEVVSKDVLSKCDQCENLCDTYVNCFNSRCHNLFIQCNFCRKKFHNCCSEHCFKTLLK